MPEKLQNPLFSLCLRSTGDPEGPPQSGPGMGPKRVQIWSQNGTQNGPQAGPWPSHFILARFIFLWCAPKKPNPTAGIELRFWLGPGLGPSPAWQMHSLKEMPLPGQDLSGLALARAHNWPNAIWFLLVRLAFFWCAPKSCSHEQVGRHRFN